MQTLEVTKKNAVAAFNKADNTGKELLKNLFGESHFNQSVLDRVKTMEDVYSELNIDKEAFEKSFMFKEDLDAAKVRLIAKVLNEGWEPDWNNSNQIKYVPYFGMNDPSGVGFSDSNYDRWSTHSNVGSRLCFKSEKLVLHVIKQFKTEYENHFIIKK